MLRQSFILQKTNKPRQEFKRKTSRSQMSEGPTHGEEGGAPVRKRSEGAKQHHPQREKEQKYQSRREGGKINTLFSLFVVCFEVCPFVSVVASPVLSLVPEGPSNVKSVGTRHYFLRDEVLSPSRLLDTKKSPLLVGESSFPVFCAEHM